MPPTVRQLLQESAKQLRDAGIDTPNLDAELILGKAANLSRTALFTHPEFEPQCEAVDAFLKMLSRRRKREPLAYILGEREFYGITFEVTPDVLIPRPDTEILVDTAIGLLENLQHPIVADIGLGSGAIAISIAASVPSAVVYGSEFAKTALSIACRNAERAGVADRVHFMEGDLLSPFVGQQFDLIVTNPPYIPSAEIDSLEPEVAAYEPRQALDGGPDGLEYYRRLTSTAAGYLNVNGVLAMEVGMGESTAVSAMLKTEGYTDIQAVKDYSGIERVVYGRRGEVYADCCNKG